MTLVKIDGSRIRDWESFHTVFADALGFAGFYGRNMNAWVDCLGYVDDPKTEMTSIHVAAGQVLTLQIEHVNTFASQAPEQYQAMLECAAFVNWRRTERGESPVIAFAFCRS